GDVRLCDRPAVAHAGPRVLLDALRPVRAASARAERGSDQEGEREVDDYGHTLFREDPYPPEGVRLPRARPVDDRDRRHGEAHRRAPGRAGAAADREEQVDGAALAARRQEVA